MSELDKKVIHTVLLRLRDGVTSAQVATLADAFRAMEGIPGVSDIHFGPNVERRAEMRKGFDHGFSLRFEDSTARDVYQAHPLHLAVAEIVQAISAEFIVCDLST